MSHPFSETDARQKSRIKSISSKPHSSEFVAILNCCHRDRGRTRSLGIQVDDIELDIDIDLSISDDRDIVPKND